MKNSMIERPSGDAKSSPMFFTSSCRYSSITTNVCQWITIAWLRLVVLLSVIFVLAGETSDSFAADVAVIDVTQFGAKADGETDDTASIQKAIDSVGLSGGTVVE